MRWHRSARLHGEFLHARHDVARKEHDALVLLVQRAVVLDRLQYVHVCRMYGGAVRVPELGDELVSEDVHVGDHERGRHASLRRCMGHYSGGRHSQLSVREVEVITRMRGELTLHQADITLDLRESKRVFWLRKRRGHALC